MSYADFASCASLSLLHSRFCFIPIECHRGEKYLLKLFSFSSPRIAQLKKCGCSGPCHLQHERSCSMTLIALTECCRLLAIDGKTLRRWLAQAQLPVQAHPSDARCKGLSGDHLLLLASAHHRRL